jgi:hypothetical protein
LENENQFSNLKTAGGIPPATPTKTLRSPPFREGYPITVFIKINTKIRNYKVRRYF